MNSDKVTVAIVGMGFSGLMTAVHLIRKASSPIKLVIINKGHSNNRGPAYSSENASLVLNVPTAKMSCFGKEADHFLNWVSNHQSYKHLAKELLAISFMPRKIYGEYLTEVWNETLSDNNGVVEVELVNDYAIGIDEIGERYSIEIENSENVISDFIILATGNDRPGDPEIPNMNFYNSEDYFNDPWNSKCVRDLDNESNVLIIGNGLTMVDTVIGLVDNGFHGKIYSISPNGLAMLQHRHGGVAYKGLVDELKEPYELDKLFALFKKHVKMLRDIGISAEPVVDSVRGVSQKIWMNLSERDKVRFIKNLRHLWGVARHRVPIQVYDRIIRLKLDGRLTVIKGRLIDIQQDSESIRVEYRNKKTALDETLKVSRVINCTGPQTNISKCGNAFVRSLLEKGLIRPDPLRLGIDADTNYRVVGDNGIPNDRIRTLGGNLKGLLWESTAVPELRVQAEDLSDTLLQELSKASEPVLL